MKHLIAFIVLVLTIGFQSVPRTGYIESIEPEFVQPVEGFVKHNPDTSFSLSDPDGMKITLVYGLVPPQALAVANHSALYRSCKITVSEEVKNYPVYKLKHLLAHEIAHCFGLKHEGTMGDIMHTTMWTSLSDIPTYRNYENTWGPFYDKLNSERGKRSIWGISL